MPLTIQVIVPASETEATLVSLGGTGTAANPYTITPIAGTKLGTIEVADAANLLGAWSWNVGTRAFGRVNIVAGTMIYPLLSAQEAAAAAIAAYDPPTRAEATEDKDEVLAAVEAIEGGGGGSGSGDGARTVTPTVLVGGVPLQNATIRFTLGAETYSGKTGSNGQKVFNLDDGTYTVSISKPGYLFSGDTLEVNGTETPSYTMASNISPNPGPAGTCLVTIPVIDELGDPLAGVEVWSELEGSQFAGSLVVSTGRRRFTNADGIAHLSLIQGGEFTIGDGIYDLKFKTKSGIATYRYKAPNTDTALLEITL